MRLLWLSFATLCLTLSAWAVEQPIAAPPNDGEMIANDTLAAPGDSYDDGTGGVRTSDLEASVFRREAPVAYHANGRRDPFRAMLVDSKKEGDIHTDLLVLDGATLTGVVWSGQNYLAMVKDKDGTSFFLREGDPVYQGRVVEISQVQAVFALSSFGDTDRITLKVRK
jgi:hypothetical protein